MNEYDLEFQAWDLEYENMIYDKSPRDCANYWRSHCIKLIERIKFMEEVQNKMDELEEEE
jgi:hypothetical protein